LTSNQLGGRDALNLGELWKSGKLWNSPLLGEFKAPPPGEHMLGPIQKVDAPMRRYPNDEEVDFCIVGLGAGGGVMLQRLAKAGFSVVGFEAGPFWDTERDWVSDEAGSHKLYWNDLRIIGGENPLTLGIQTVAPEPIAFAKQVMAAMGAWGGCAAS
jgi:hypothetical protein